MRSITKPEKKIKMALDREFPPPDRIEIEPGFQDNLHVTVISGKFKGKTEKQKQDMLWQALYESDALTDADRSKISLIRHLTPGEVPP